MDKSYEPTITMRYLHAPLTSYTNYPIYNTHIYNNYELENQAGIASCINYPICNTYFKGHAKTNRLFVQAYLRWTLKLKMQYPHWYYAKNHMSNMTHAIFTYKQILNWGNM